MEKRIEIYYGDVDPKFTLYFGLIGIAISAIIANYYPDLGWVVLIFLVMLPFQVMKEAKAAKRKKAGLPALVIDGYTLEYKGKKIDLSEMCAAGIIVVPEDGHLVIIYRKGRLINRPVMSISTEDMLISDADLLKLIQERIESAQQNNPTQ